MKYNEKLITSHFVGFFSFFFLYFIFHPYSSSFVQNTIFLFSCSAQLGYAEVVVQLANHPPG